MSRPPVEPPLVRHLRTLGVSLCWLTGDDDPKHTPLPNDVAEAMLAGLVSESKSSAAAELRAALNQLLAAVEGTPSLKGLMDMVDAYYVPVRGGAEAAVRRAHAALAAPKGEGER